LREDTAVVIVGAGPAGLLLANRLIQEGVDCVVLERHTRAAVEARARAGVLEHRSAELLARHGLADGMHAAAAKHGTCEFRRDGTRFTVPYGELAGGVAHWVYPQQFLVRDLIASFLEAGGDLRFAAEVGELAEVATERPSVTYRQAGEDRQRTLRARLVAGCDGPKGVCARQVPAGARRVYERQHEWGWLTVLAAAPPSTEHPIYALHRRGFAGHMLRTATVSRYYLQCVPGDPPENWPAERIWSELDARLAVDEPWSLTRGELLETRTLEMRSVVSVPMQHGSLYLAGDAAHVITPVGAKGANLALADADVLATAMTRYLRDGDRAALDAYSDTRLPAIWRAQAFSRWLMELVHAPADGDGFAAQLQRARMDELRTNPSLAAWFAGQYVGA
jgi:p-hydroxybenzoate 3-monooxygenase